MITPQAVASDYSVRFAVIAVFSLVSAATGLGAVVGLLVGFIATAMLNV